MEEKSTATLEKIQQAAMEEFSEKGFQGASLRQIVKQAGVTTGALYGYFSGKEALSSPSMPPSEGLSPSPIESADTPPASARLSPLRAASSASAASRAAGESAFSTWPSGRGASLRSPASGRLAAFLRLAFFIQIPPNRPRRIHLRVIRAYYVRFGA